MTRFLLILLASPALLAAEPNPPHWAFLPPRHAAPPRVRLPDRVRTPVDAFILARLEQANLPPAPEADRETLLRRACFTLTGLPPTTEERSRFLNDDRADAYEQLVERLLASPAFGERWAQHWLDVVRFAETNGYEGDALRPHAWRYRDYVVRSFNDDKPYSTFLTEQLAGDLLARTAEGSRRIDCLTAAGLHRCGPQHVVSGNLDAEVLRQEWLTEITDGVGGVFLGLTLGCARCHDHKFDPLSQKDYYRLGAFFADVQAHDVDISSQPERDEHARRTQELTGKLAPLRKAVAAIDAPHRARLGAAKKAKLDPAHRDALAVEAGKRTADQRRLAEEAMALTRVTWDEVLAVLDRKEAAERSRLRKEIHELQSLMPTPPAHAWTLGPTKPTPTHVLKRGDVKRKGEAVQSGYPTILAEACPEKTAGLPDRVALARWLTRPDHPLTARVIVNRLWQHHFGRGLVTTPSDFGTRGSPPSHPELLDWLAVELVRSGWSLKHMHRLMVLSSTYRQDSRHRDPEAEKRDPDNRLLWRMNRQRLDAEALRDAMLAVSGSLTRGLSGPSVRVPLEPEVYDLIFTEDEPDGLWTATPDRREHSRRSLYLFRKRNVRLPMLEAFDQPDALTGCACRAVSTFAPQALILLNGPLAQEQSRAFAARLKAGGCRAPGDIIERGFILALGRQPRSAERAASIVFLEGDGALEDFCLALLNGNEFLYVR